MTLPSPLTVNRWSMYNLLYFQIENWYSYVRFHILKSSVEIFKTNILNIYSTMSMSGNLRMTKQVVIPPKSLAAPTESVSPRTTAATASTIAPTTPTKPIARDRVRSCPLVVRLFLHFSILYCNRYSYHRKSYKLP